MSRRSPSGRLWATHGLISGRMASTSVRWHSTNERSTPINHIVVARDDGDDHLLTACGRARADRRVGRRPPNLCPHQPATLLFYVSHDFRQLDALARDEMKVLCVARRSAAASASCLPRFTPANCTPPADTRTTYMQTTRPHGPLGRTRWHGARQRTARNALEARQLDRVRRVPSSGRPALWLMGREECEGRVAGRESQRREAP